MPARALYPALVALALAPAGPATPAASTLTVHCPPPARDCTTPLQAAFTAPGVTTVVVGPGRKVWPVRPLFLLPNSSHRTIRLAAGVVLHAMKGEFKGGADALLTCDGAVNVSVVGEGGATLLMRRMEYANASLYTHGDSRHGVAIHGCDRFSLHNLTIRGSGGDGIYLAGRCGSQGCLTPVTANASTNTVIDGVVSDLNYRQGISVISAVNLSVSNSVFSNTGNPGTSPEAGVDLEPNQPSDRMAGIVFRNCTAAGNVGDGFNINLHMLDLPCPGAQAPSKTAPCGRPEEVDILVEDLVVEGQGVAAKPGGPTMTQHGIHVGSAGGGGNGSGTPTGVITFRRATVRNVLLAGAAVIRKPLATGLRVGFADCVFEGTALSQGRGWYLNAATGVNHTASTGQGRSPIEVSLSSGYVAGGASFDNCSVTDSLNRPFFRFGIDPPWDCAVAASTGVDNCAGVADVAGNRFRVRNKFASGCVADLGPPSLLRKERNVSVRVLDCETDAASNSADFDE